MKGTTEMKSIAQIYADRLKRLPVGKNGKADPQDCLRLKWEAYGAFWAPFWSILDPRDERLQPGAPAEQFFSTRYRLSPADRGEGLKLLKQLLRVERLSHSTFYKVSVIVGEAIQKANTWYDVDIALCAVLVFVQLELGGQPNPEYGEFPRAESSWHKLRDENLSDDPAIAEAELNFSEFDGIGASESRSARLYGEWSDTIEDATKFENVFPGMAHRRAHVAQALRPIFDHLDPFYAFHTLEMCMAWMSRLLRSPLEEHRLPSKQSPAVKGGSSDIPGIVDAA
jgi:hypothetical protein